MPLFSLPSGCIKIILQSLKIEAMWCSGQTITGSLGQVTKKKEHKKEKMDTTRPHPDGGVINRSVEIMTQ